MKLTRKKPQENEYIAVSISGNTKYNIKDPFREDVMINHKKSDIKILEENGFTYILFNRKKYLAEIVEKNQNKYVVLINGVSYAFCIETPISFKRRKYLDKTRAKSKTELICAPMPGKIVDILVEPGARVKEGESLLILEAMKMQNEIASTVPGTVKSVHIRQNDIVNKEDILVEIEK
jgi:biotin carboxyl carrier protein